MLFAPSLCLMGHWFEKKRGMATAMTGFGVTIGGTAVPIIVRQLIPKVG